eukprot:CAMPEP_0118954068 /NCGR_PEP_ID=MMETSP1169-20130426/57649_1 /TAXON_ID=36882 /ORGANISM="Pyramimonas obovata, Strain CCMP722" /LENGTH=172 /DNA_ID=CAMNT_0006901641 /DNA_START=124 /DNA_END=639 /DNA_ORIENTATION=-
MTRGFAMQGRHLSAPSMMLQRETHGRTQESVAIRSSHDGGVLVLDEDLQIYSAMPHRLLDDFTTPGPHYLELGGIRATCLLDFGGSPAFWGNITKLYASRCRMRSLDGIDTLHNMRFLYLDQNELPEAELLRILDELPAAADRLEVLDVRDNIGCTPQVELQLTNGLCELQW